MHKPLDRPPVVKSVGATPFFHSNPADYGVDLLDEEDGRILRISFTDNAYNRVMVALVENLGQANINAAR